jgi:hypothetical protein
LNTARNIFLVLFIISTLGVLVLFVQFSANSLPPEVTPTPPPTQPLAVTQNPDTVEPTAFPIDPETEPSSQNTKMGAAALIGSLITSVTSLIGFVTTTVITWRKEKRETSLSNMELKKLEAELEKSRLELERLKKSRAKKRKK